VSQPLCIVVGAGRLAAGYVAPLLADAGWRVVLVGRSPEVISAVQAWGGVTVCVVGPGSRRRWVGGVGAVDRFDPGLPDLVARADLVAVSVGPGALGEVGGWLGPLLRGRLDARPQPLNVLTFENHRRAPELLAEGLLTSTPSLATEIGHRLGLVGAAAWQVVSRREVGPGGLTLHTDGVVEAYLDSTAMIGGVPPVDGSLPGPVPVEPFDAWMAEKLWVFNGGHAAAAYLGALAGCVTVDEAMARPQIRAQVRQVLVESSSALASMRGADHSHDLDAVLARYADPSLADPVSRVAREPRRKLAAGDRLVGPAVAARAAGIVPVALAQTMAAALAYREPTDPQAVTLAGEIDLVGPAEVLEMISFLHPGDELSALVCANYEELTRRKVTL
jgi:mannitol-1-phosphate 5-dehydrogenase